MNFVVCHWKVNHLHSSAIVDATVSFSPEVSVNTWPAEFRKSVMSMISEAGPKSDSMVYANPAFMRSTKFMSHNK